MATLSALYAITVKHVRREPLLNSFAYRSYQWFIDPENPPKLPWWLAPFAQFRSRDHLGSPEKTIGANLRDYLAEHGVAAEGPISMLSNAAVLGYVFNPLSLFWCHHHDGSLACIVAEVHNTYGQRHVYLLGPEASTKARISKEFYVSPFYPVDGEYLMSLPEPTQRAQLSIVLERAEEKPFVATVLGHRIPATRRNISRMLLDIPLAPLRVSVQIFYQGVKLWWRKLPVQTRPQLAPQPEHQSKQPQNQAVETIQEALK